MARFLKNFHLSMVVVWGLLSVPTILLWKESVLWVAIMSLWANIASHWSAYSAERAEEQATDPNGQS